MAEDEEPPLPTGGTPGTVRPTPAGPLVAWGVAGLVGGWLLRHALDWVGGTPPLVSWLQVLALYLVAAILAATAAATWRQVHVRREWLEPHRAGNRLVLAKACALVGALLAGGYAGYALSWLGDEAALAGQRIGRSVFAALAGVAIITAALALERACRVHEDDEDN